MVDHLCFSFALFLRVNILPSNHCMLAFSFISCSVGGCLLEFKATSQHSGVKTTPLLINTAYRLIHNISIKNKSLL